MDKKTRKNLIILGVAAACIGLQVVAIAAGIKTSGIGDVAAKVTSNLGNIAKLITAASYVAGMGFAVGSIVKFKAHKDNPTQVPIGMPVALLFVAAALIFIPSVYQASGSTLFGSSGSVAGISGITSFGIVKAS